MDSASPSSELPQQALVDMAHWIGRVQQYSPQHPSSRALTEKVFASLSRALAVDSPLDFGILKDGVMLGGEALAHPALRSRLAPHLHDRGVLVLRFQHGLTLAELNAFAELIILPVQAVFDHGGLKALLADRRIDSVQVEELAHDITEEQLERGRRRRRLREFFTDAMRHLRAARAVGALVGDRLVEMLAFPEVTASILEDQGAGIAEAAAGLALLVQQEEQRTGEVLAPKLREILRALLPMTRDRLLLGFPPLVGEFRAALAWAMRGYREDELASFIFPSFRARAHELDLVLYAISVLVTHDGTRLSMLRRVGLLLHDLPYDDAVAHEVLGAIARPVDEFESYRRERLCMVEAAGRALGARQLSAIAYSPDAAAPPALPPVDGRVAVRELVRLASYTRQFEHFLARVPDAAAALARHGAAASLLELVRALGQVQESRWRDLVTGAIDVVTGQNAAVLLVEIERTLPTMSPDEQTVAAGLVRSMAVRAPKAVLDHMDLCVDERLHKLLLDALPHGGPRMLGLVCARLTPDAGPTVLSLLSALPRLGGRPEDVLDLARHRDEAVRLELVRLLRALPADERTMEIVVRFLGDPSPKVRAAVRLMVRGDLLTPATIAAVGRLLEDHAQPEEVQRRLIQALGQSRHDAAAQQLFHLLQPHGLIELGAASLRELVAATLRESPAPAAAKLFQDGLASESRRVRKACEKAAARGAG